ncbi:MAG: TRAP transporter permease, partial [Elioraea sp.]|nr:TRAP transporter permease [Elioraea sp.]
MRRESDADRAAELERQYDSGLAFREPTGWLKPLASVVLVALSVYQIYTAGFGLPPEHWHNAIYLAAVLALVFLFFDARVPLGPRLGGVALID